MHIDPDEAQELLHRADPGRLCRHRALGLRDGALLALLAAGLSAVEIAALKEKAITAAAGNRIVVTVRRKTRRHLIVLKSDQAARVIAWLTEHHLWGPSEHLFPGAMGPLTAIGVRKVLARYARRRARRNP